jgi:ribosomal protein L11 methyltransferase
MIDVMRSYPALSIIPIDTPLEFLDLVAAALDDYGVIALEERDDSRSVRAYFADGSRHAAATQALLQAFPGATVEALDVPDENWAERSQAALRAIRAGNVVVAPPWDSADVPGTTRVVILPSMGFGTGHHATTRLCLEALQTVGVSNKTVVDVGTGSGVLAIAAAKLGAARVVALDNDQDAVDSAAENLVLNQATLELRCASIEDEQRGSFDVVIANLTGATLIRFGSALTTLCRSDGRLILSGLREEEEAGVLEAFSRFECAGRQTEEGWCALVLIRTVPQA